MILELLRDAELDEPPLWSGLQELFVSGSPPPKDKDSPLPAVIIKIFLQILPSIACHFFGPRTLRIPFQVRSIDTVCQPRHRAEFSDVHARHLYFAQLFRNSLDHQ
jgi:hypothetical protein